MDIYHNECSTLRHVTKSLMNGGGTEFCNSKGNDSAFNRFLTGKLDVRGPLFKF